MARMAAISDAAILAALPALSKELSVQYHVQAEITLKPTVMDAQGTTIEKALHKLGHAGVHNVRIGKFVTMIVDADTPDAAKHAAAEMCQELLANPIIEQYAVQVVEAEGGV
jgi:phosphoribosylformylglycinamidine synthase PurS subunit